mgnify:FL=1
MEGATGTAPVDPAATRLATAIEVPESITSGGDGDALAFRFVDRWILKGRTEPTDMFEVAGTVADLGGEGLEALAVYHQGLQRYFQQDFAAARQCFARSAELEPLRPGRDVNITTPASLIMAQRCQHYALNPPGNDWDGVHAQTSK